MAKCFIGWEQRALRAGASSDAAPFEAANVLDPDFDRAWASAGLTGEYLEFMTGGLVFGERVASVSVSANLRAAHLHPTAGWVLCAVSTQLEVRAWNRKTGAVAETATDTQARPASANSWLGAKFSPDGRYILATCEADSSLATVRLRHFDPATGQIGAAITVPSAETELPPTGLRGLAWAANSKGFAMIGNDDLNVWSFNPDTATATFVQARDLGASSANCLDWHPNVDTTSYIAVGHANSPYLGKFDVTLTAGVPTAVSTVTDIGVSPGAAVVAVKFSPTGDRLAIATSGPLAAIYPFTTTFGTIWSAPATNLSSTRAAIEWGPEGDYVVYGGGGTDDPDVWPVTASAWGTKDTAFADTPDAYANSLSISADGAFMAAISSAGVLQITEFDEAPAAAESIEGLALKGVNLTRSAQLRLRGDTQRDMASGSAYDTGTFDAFDQTNVSQKLFNQIDGAFGTNVYVVLDAAVTKKFWRLDITDADNPDGQFIVQFMLATVPLDRTRNWEIGSVFDVEHASSSKTETDGGADIIRKRPGRRFCRMPIGNIDAATARDSFYPLSVEGPTRLMLVLPDPSDRRWCHEQGFIGRLDEGTNLTWAAMLINAARINATEAR